VEIPATAELGMLQRALEITAEELGVGVTLRPAESDDL
jgi:glycine cleavage system transcriptional repressor